MQQDYNEKIDTALNDIKQEVLSAKAIYKADFVNQHEAYAIILEEVDELWGKVKKEPKEI